MKTKIILLLLICLCSTAKAQYMNGDSIITWSGQISLKGDWEKGLKDDKGHRSISFIPIVATVDNKIISIDFWNMTGVVTVSIIQKDEVQIYSNSILINVLGHFAINVGNYLPGVYLLKFSNQDGGYVYGWFEI